MQPMKQTFFVSAALVITFLLNPIISPAGEKLAKTPRDHEGPFYPIVRQQDEDNDLLHVAGREQAATGDRLHLSGKVVDEDGRPITNAFVEIWQTDPNGRYNDERDRTPGPRDPDFQYWGLAATAKDGSFSFLTLIPGEYEPRPAHIHFKVWVDRELKLTSQIYFRTPADRTQDAVPGATGRELQTVGLHRMKEGEYEAFIQIVL